MKRVNVIVGVIEHPQHGVLIARRQAGQHLAGLWEFPGGKIEDGESHEAALQRELDEELGISVKTCSWLCTIEHTYPEKHVALHVYRVSEFSGEAIGREGQQILWVPKDSIAGYEFPEANKEILEKLLSVQ